MKIMIHKGDYSALAILITGYLIFVFRFQTIPQYLLLATIAFALLYIIWGIMHHLRTHSLHPRVVLEYFLVAGLAITLIATLLV